MFKIIYNVSFQKKKRLNFHLEDEHPIIYTENISLDNVLNIHGIKETKFTELMKTNVKAFKVSVNTFRSHYNVA